MLTSHAVHHVACTCPHMLMFTHTPVTCISPPQIVKSELKLIRDMFEKPVVAAVPEFDYSQHRRTTSAGLGGTKKVQTLGSQFTEQLTELMTTLQSTSE